MPDAMMKHLAGPFWFANPKRFLEPGLYFCRNGNKRIIPFPTPPKSIHLIEFPEQTVIYAKYQPEYNPLPAHKFPNDAQGRIACCWKLNIFERIRVLITGRIWHQIATFDEPLQPQLLSVEKPEMVKPEILK